MRMEMIRLEHVTKSFGNIKIVEDFNYIFARFEKMGIVGNSGTGKSTFIKMLMGEVEPDSGKTTMLRMINGLQKPDSGKVYAAGEDVGEADLIRLRRKIGYVIQNKGLFPHMTVEKNIIYVPVISGQKDKRQNRKLAEELIGLVGLEREMLDRYPEELSGGQQQRVAIARAVVSNPKIILADEPTGNLDSKNGAEVMQLLTELNKEGTTIVMVTHSKHDAGFAHRVINLFDGSVVSSVSEFI